MDITKQTSLLELTAWITDTTNLLNSVKKLNAKEHKRYSAKLKKAVRLWRIAIRKSIAEITGFEGKEQNTGMEKSVVVLTKTPYHCNDIPGTAKMPHSSHATHGVVELITDNDRHNVWSLVRMTGNKKKRGARFTTELPGWNLNNLINKLDMLGTVRNNKPSYNYKHVTYRQIGGDDGYQYAVIGKAGHNAGHVYMNGMQRDEARTKAQSIDERIESGKIA